MHIYSMFNVKTGYYNYIDHVHNLIIISIISIMIILVTTTWQSSA